MAKYKCKNPECKHVWDSDDEPVECPCCRQDDFVKLGGGAKWIKGVGIAVGVVILLIILVTACPGEKDTKVTTDADQFRCRLTVKITGRHNQEYKISLRKGGAVYGEVNKRESATFSELEGTYTLDVKFVGKGNLPKINAYQRTFTFVRPLEAPEAPQIKRLAKSPDRLTKNVKVYSVNIETDESIVPLSETEFSADGIHWQRTSRFTDLSAGTYTFIARNTRDNSLQDSKTMVLDPFVAAPLPNKAQLNELLAGIARRNQEDLDRLIEILGSNTVVKGIGNVGKVGELANEVYIQRRLVQVTDIKVVNGVIVEIRVQER